MHCTSHPPWFYHSNYTWRTVQAMKLLIMQFSSTSYHFISLRSKYSPEHRVLKHPQSMFIPTFSVFIIKQRHYTATTCLCRLSHLYVITSVIREILIIN
jgi:hypothetical protein